MKKLTDEQMAKLPKWAQSHINVLQNSLDYYMNERKTMFSTPADEADVLLTHFHGADGKASDNQPLPSHQGVKFFPLGRQPNDEWRNYVEVRLDPNRPGELDVHSSNMLYIVPHATNSVKIKLAERE